MGDVYSRELTTKKAKIALMRKIKISLSDTIYKCERVRGNNSDANLKVLEFNTQIVANILEKNKIQKIYFSSSFVEKIYKQHFKEIIKKHPGLVYITLPSSSPRFAAMNIKDKIKRFRELMPSI